MSDHETSFTIKHKSFFGLLLVLISLRTVGSIIHGEKSKEGEFPWLVAFVNVPKNTLLCSGSLISAKDVLTGIIKLSSANILKFNKQI